MTALTLSDRQARPRASTWTSSVRWPERGTLELAVLVAAAAAGLAAAYRPLWVLAACLLAGLVALVWMRPATAAYLLVGVTPLVAGIDRGVVVPVFRPNEPLLLVLGATLAARWLLRLRSGHVPLARPDAVDLAVLLLAVTSSVTPLMAMAVRGRTVSTDDLLYSLVLWKLAGSYFIVRAAVRSERQVHRCLVVSVVAACLVAVIGILQGFDVLGVRSFLGEYYAPFGHSERIATLTRGGSTLALPAATADLMIMNLAVVAVLWLRRLRRTLLTRVVHTAVTGLLITATLAAGEFSTTIGLVIAMGALALVAGSVAVFGHFSGLAVVGGVVAWPVIAERLEGFSAASGIPVSWLGRLHNLQTYFWPELSSLGNLVLGVRPSARVPVASQATGWVWIESGYIWLLWGGGIPLLASFLFFTYVVAARGSRLARTRYDAVGAAGAAAFVGVVVIAVLMVFDPHLTYRGSGDEAFALVALMAGAAQRRPWTTGGGLANRDRGVLALMGRATRRRRSAGESERSEHVQFVHHSPGATRPERRTADVPRDRTGGHQRSTPQDDSDGRGRPEKLAADSYDELLEGLRREVAELKRAAVAIRTVSTRPDEHTSAERTIPGGCVATAAEEMSRYSARSSSGGSVGRSLTAAEQHGP